MSLLQRMPLPEDQSRRERATIVFTASSKRLKAIAKDFLASSMNDGEVEFVRKSSEAKGAFSARMEPFLTPEMAVLHPHDCPTTLYIPPIDNPTSDQQTLVVEIIRAMTVVDVVLNRRLRKPNSVAAWVRAKLGKRDRQNGLPPRDFSKDTQQLREIYLRQLKDIFDGGLSLPNAATYALQRLQAFKDSFVAREADYVKNQHVKKLGFWALIFAFLLMSTYIILSMLKNFIGISETNMIFYRNFLFLAAGSCGGTWLSFSLRRVSLGFGDLAALEEDRLNPTGRIVFVMMLTCVLGLFLHSGLIQIMVGTNPITVKDSVEMAILIGALCGIAERSLSSAVSRRAEDVIGAAGGGSPKIGVQK